MITSTSLASNAIRESNKPKRAKKSKPKAPIVEKSPVQRSIEAKERGLARMEQHKKRIRDNADVECAAIDKRMAVARVMLAALNRGELQP